MAQVRKSWRQLLDYAQTSEQWLARNPGRITKLSYAISRVNSQLLVIQKRVTEELEDIDLTHCAVDEKGLVIGGPGSYRYDRDELRQRNKDRIEYLDREQFDVETHYASDIPADLTDYELDRFEGIVIEESVAADIRRNRLADSENPGSERTALETPPNGADQPSAT